MALHIVLGNGEMSRKELTETLKDLWERAGDHPFWFILQGKSDPSDTDGVLMKWMHTNEIYYEVLTDDEDAMADIYGSAQATHVAKRLPQQVVKLLNSGPDEGETADVLALFSADDPQAEEDRWLNTALQAVYEAGFKVFAMNDGLTELDLDPTADAAEQEQEEEEVAPAPKKAVSKSPAKKAAKPAPEEETEYTREQLNDMELPELKDIAAAKGIELAPRTRMSTYIDAILGESKPEAPAVEVTEPPVTITKDRADEPSANGDVDLDRLAEEITAIVIEKIVAALQTA